jgi:ABC-type amino acid transport substrate-binding protein
MRPFFLFVLLTAQVGAFGQTPVTVDIGDQPPLLSAQGGIVNRVVEAALTRMGYRVTFNWLPIGRMLASLQEDRSDLYVTPSNTAGQQNPHLDLLSARGVFFYKKGASAPVVRRLEDLAGKTVGTVLNSPLRSPFEKAGILVDEGPFETMFDKLDAGRVDFVSTADVGGILTIRAKYPQRVSEFDWTEFSYTEIKVGLYAKDRPSLRAILEDCRKGFSLMKEDASLTALLKEFFGPENFRRVRIY